MKKLISFVLKSIIFCVVWFIQMTIIIYFTMEMYGELRPNPSIAIGGLTSLYLSYRLVKKINLSKFFDFLSKRKDNSISQQEEPMKKEVSEPTAVKKGNKILFMPKKVFYKVSTLCLIAVIAFVYCFRFILGSGLECSPNSIFFNVKFDRVTNISNTVVVDDIRYNKSDMTLFSGEYTSEESYFFSGSTYYAYNYQNGLKHGYSYVWQWGDDAKEFEGYYIFRGKYKKGLKHGLIEEWYNGGQIKSRGNYKDGLRDGLIEEWYYNGQLKSKGNYKNGQEDGVIEEWYSNGQTVEPTRKIYEMNEKQRGLLYYYIKSQDATDLKPNQFFAAYGDPYKAKDVWNFVKGQDMTDLNEADFFSAYFGNAENLEPTADMKKEILKNVWGILSSEGATESDFETWRSNFAGNAEIQTNVYEYLINGGYTESDFETWSTNVGLKKR